MIIKQPKFEISAMNPKQYPTNELPEIVLAGKSNVGKSSFINTMLNRKSLARTSSEPGKTRQINFYNIDESFYFVDLPGYGYSKMSKAEQDKVSKAIETYLTNRKELRVLVLLIDIRHKPSQNDKLMYDFIKNINIPHLLIASKADKIPITKLDSYLDVIREELDIPNETLLIPSSSVKKIYTEDVWKVLEYYINPA